MVFNPGASAYTISNTAIASITGSGIINNSGVTQSIPCKVDSEGSWGEIFFYNNATSGENVNYDVQAADKSDFIGADMEFHDQSHAGSGVFTVTGGLSLDLSSHNAPGAALGSLEGDGIVTMGALNLT